MNFLLSIVESDPALGWAMFGGLVVIAGLIIEEIADFLNERFLSPPEKPHERMRFIGWFILLVGICIETADAGWTAYEMRRTDQNIARIDPPNRLISRIEVDVNFELSVEANFGGMSLSMRAAPRFLFSSPEDARLELCETNMRAVEEAGVCILSADGLDRIGGVLSVTTNGIMRHGYAMHFHLNPDSRGVKTFLTEKPVSEVISNVNFIKIYCKYLPHDVGVLFGQAEMTVNDSPKHFTILQQSPLSEKDGGLGVGLRDDGFTIIATNLPPN